MRHHQAGRKLGRKRGPRLALRRSLVVNLIKRERIQTTEAKAKELRPHIESLITHARRGTLASRRLLLARLGNNQAVAKKLVDVIAPRYAERPGGYTRINKLPTRRTDAACLAVIEFV